MRAAAPGLGLTVFLAGIASLGTEIAAARLVAPYFGSSNVVWANVIGLVLGFLSIGYWLGGKVADARPRPALLGGILLAAALALMAVPFASRPLLHASLRGFDSLSVGIVIGSFVGVLTLFVVPVVLMGAVSPFALRLAMSSVAESGRTAGRLYALSTAGSILGTFVAALVAIPLIGTQRTLLGCAGLLALAAVPLSPRAGLGVIALAAGLAALPPGGIKRTTGVIWEGESAYQYVRVLQYDDGSRALELNEGIAQQSVWYPHTVLTGGYWDLFDVIPALGGRSVRSALVLGDAGGTIPRAYAQFFPHLRVDGVEIDPTVTEAARRFLGLGAIRTLHTFTDDARVFLQRSTKRYDVVIVDAYRQPYIPFQLATEEFFELVRKHLTPGGVVALNIASTPRDHGLTNGIAATLRAVFPQVWRWRALRFSDLLLALDRPQSRGVLVARAANLPRPLQPLVPLLDRELTDVTRGGAPWTDDRAPVEWVTDRMLAEQIANGQGLDEHYLPTAPP